MHMCKSSLMINYVTSVIEYQKPFNVFYFQNIINPVTSISNKDRIPTYIINTMSSRLVIRRKKIRELLVDPITNSPN